MSLTFGEQRTEGQKLYDAAVMERVKAGMALLEEKHGPDWVDHINPETLELRSGGACVLGQVYGHYADGVRELWPDLAEEADERNEEYDDSGWEEISAGVGYQHGFFAASDGGEVGPDEDWDALNAAWRDALTPVITKT